MVAVSRKHHISQSMVDFKGQSYPLRKFRLAPRPWLRVDSRMNRFLPLATIVLLLIAFRIAGSSLPESFPNFQPLAALFFCGAIMLKGWKGWAIPLGAWLVTYPAPALLQGNGSYMDPGILLTTAIGFGATFLIGKSLGGRNTAVLLLGTVGAAVAFHLITNGAAWAFGGLYPKTPAGLWQSFWGVPAGGVLPNWVFLRNMVGANLLFTAIFLSARFALPRFSSAAEPVAVR